MAADNQQETLKNYYYTGFCAGEMYCGLMKLSHNKGGSGFYFTPDLTVANADLNILKKLNTVVFLDSGIMSPIKGGYNLKIRGWRKVKAALSFFQKFPPLKNSILWHKMNLLNKAFGIFERKQNLIRTDEETRNFETIISQFKELQSTSKINGGSESYDSARKLGYFFSGLFDAEGSIGLRKRGATYQPFFAIGMRDQHLVKKFQEFIGEGYVYYRPHQNIFHFETGHRKVVDRLIKMFTFNFPLKLEKSINRLNKLQRILNDHTRGPEMLPMYYDGLLW